MPPAYCQQFQQMASTAPAVLRKRAPLTLKSVLQKDLASRFFVRFHYFECAATLVGRAIFTSCQVDHKPSCPDRRTQVLQDATER
jgi:hypothetical protein